MKLLYIVPRLGGAGGLQRVLLLKAGYLSQKGYDITILVTNPDVQEIMFPVAKGITIKRIALHKMSGLSYFFAYRKAIATTVRELQPDVVVQCDNGLKSFFLPWLVPAKLPLVYEMHTSKFLIEAEVKSNILLRLLFKGPLVNFLLSKFTRFVALTPGGAEEWQLKNSMVISNPLWLKSEVYNPLIANKIVVMGRHAPQKGYERMFSIWEKVSKKFPDWVLQIYGAPNPAYDLKKLAAEKKLERIVFSEPVRDIELAYSQGSVSIMTSVSEPFGLVLLEAMECGLPCVAYNSPFGPQAIIKDGVNGFLIPDDDETRFVNRLQELMENESLRVKLGAGAKKTASGFNLVGIMDQWDALFGALTQRA